MHCSTKMLAMRSVYSVDGELLGPASSPEKLQLVFLRWKSGIGSAKGLVLQHLLVLVLRLSFATYSDQVDLEESDRTSARGCRWFAGS